MNDRRKYYRLAVRLEARWEGTSGTHDTTISDVSLGGCYLETIGQATSGEKIKLQLLLPTGNWLQLRGEVRYAHNGIGFGIQFWPLKPAEFELWRTFLSLMDDA